jgi:hypothetical protein
MNTEQTLVPIRYGSPLMRPLFAVPPQKKLFLSSTLALACLRSIIRPVIIPAVL